MLRELANRSRGHSDDTEAVGREQADVLRRKADGQQGSTQKGDEAPVAEELFRIRRRAVVVHRAEHKARLEAVLATEQGVVEAPLAVERRRDVQEGSPILVVFSRREEKADVRARGAVREDLTRPRVLRHLVRSS